MTNFIFEYLLQNIFLNYKKKLSFQLHWFYIKYEIKIDFLIFY